MFLKYRSLRSGGISNVSISREGSSTSHVALCTSSPPTLFPVSELKALKLPSQPARLLLKNTSISVPSGPHCGAEWERVSYWVTYLENAGAVRRPPGIQQIVLPCAHKPFTFRAETSRVRTGGKREHMHTLLLLWKETLEWPRTEARWWRHFHLKHQLVLCTAQQSSLVHAKRQSTENKKEKEKSTIRCLTTVGKFEGENTALMQV